MTPEDVWQAYRAQMTVFLRARVSDPADVEDLLQEIFLKIVHGLDTLEDPSKLRAWLFTIAQNAIIDHYRAQARRPIPHPDDLWYDQGDPTARRDLERCIDPFLDALPQESARLLKAVDINGQSQKQIADREGLPYSTLKSRVKSARAELRAVFERCCHLRLDGRGAIVDARPKSGNCETC